MTNKIASELFNQNVFSFATVSNDTIADANLDADAKANARARLIACMLKDVLNAHEYDVVCDADTLVVENCYLKVLRHSSHKSFCQVYAKRSYVLVLISRHSVDTEKDAFQHDTDVVERLSNQSCYARYKVDYEHASTFFRALTAHDTRKQTATATATATADTQAIAQ